MTDKNNQEPVITQSVGMRASFALDRFKVNTNKEQSITGKIKDIVKLVGQTSIKTNIKALMNEKIEKIVDKVD